MHQMYRRGSFKTAIAFPYKSKSKHVRIAYIIRKSGQTQHSSIKSNFSIASGCSLGSVSALVTEQSEASVSVAMQTESFSVPSLVWFHVVYGHTAITHMGKQISPVLRQNLSQSVLATMLRQCLHHAALHASIMHSSAPE